MIISGQDRISKVVETFAHFFVLYGMRLSCYCFTLLLRLSLSLSRLVKSNCLIPELPYHAQVILVMRKTRRKRKLEASVAGREN